MSKLTRESVAKLIRVRRTALYNAAGRRHGSIRYKRSKAENHRHSSVATLLWYTISALSRGK